MAQHTHTDPGETKTARRLLPTTRSQVSGHRFMRRRVEHGLIYGDIRMIHDPLAARRRSAIFGLVAVALIAAGSGLFAWLRPNPDPGAAAILRASDGAMYVRVGEAVHPVTNLTSARLIAGTAEEPQRVGEERLTEMPRGVPLGIATAPAMFAPGDAEDAVWSACEDPSSVTVVAGQPIAELADGQAVAVTQGEDEWMLTKGGRAKLPSASDAQGRIIRRALGIDAHVARAEISAPVLSAIRELPPVRLPDPLPRLLLADGTDEAWAVTQHGGIQSVSELQRHMLIDASAPTSTASPSQIAAYPDAQDPLDIAVPETAPEWLDPHGSAVCVTEQGAVALADPGSGVLTTGSVELSGESPATHFVGLTSGAVGVDTGTGYHVVSASGQRHTVDTRDNLDVVGALHVDHVPWSILSLLPEGPALTREAALTATY